MWIDGKSPRWTVLSYKSYHTLFWYQEFAITIGLNCFADKYDLFSGTSEPKRLINQYFEGKSIIRKVELISKYKKKVWGDGNDDDDVKFTILYFISMFIYFRWEEELIDSEETLPRYKNQVLLFL